jgi:hypothetical protein
VLFQSPRNFDHDFVDDVLRRLKGLRPGAKPAWGKLTAVGMTGHLIDAVRYSMGKAGGVRDRSNWLFRKVVAPLMLNGVIPIPKNIKADPLPNPSGRTDLETLHAVLDEYLALVQAGELNPKPHPAFGAIGVDGWARMHVLHFEHHLRQFGV